MRFKTKILSIIFLPILLLTGCSNFSFPTNANVAFENFALSLFKEDIASTTLGLHYTLEHPEAYGITDVPITLGTFETDIDESLATIENCQAVLNKFPYKQLSKENQSAMASYNVRTQNAWYFRYMPWKIKGMLMQHRDTLFPPGCLNYFYLRRL